MLTQDLFVLGLPPQSCFERQISEVEANACCSGCLSNRNMKSEYSGSSVSDGLLSQSKLKIGEESESEIFTCLSKIEVSVFSPTVDILRQS